MRVQQNATAVDPRLLGIEQTPVLEQLMARKACLADHVEGDAFKSHLSTLQHKFSQQGNQRGILIVAGGRDMFANAAITVLMLRRHLRSTLPIEIIHYGPKELPVEVLILLQSLNGTASSNNNGSSSSSGDTGVQGPVFVTDALQASPPAALEAFHRQLAEVKGFPAKVYALVHATRFQQVLLLDADSMPLVDPELLFNLPSFRRFGNLFWPDLWYNAWVNSTIYSMMAGMSQPPWQDKPHFRLVDSGQLLFDRLRHAEVLQYLWLLNSHHEWVYKHMHGDKDTFLLAFAMAGRLSEFRQVSCYVRDAMVEAPGHEHRFHHLGMVQSLPPGVFAAAVARASRAGVSGASLLLPPLGAAARNASSAATSSAAGVSAGSSAGQGNAARLAGLAAAAAVASPLGLRETARARRELFQHVGVPVVFHRTSFNSKFFPDCLSKDKVASKYCQVQWVSVPLSNEQASHSLKPHMYAFNADQVNTTFYEQRCRKAADPAAQNAAAAAGTSSSGGAGTGKRHLVLHRPGRWHAPVTTLRIADPAAAAAAAGDASSVYSHAAGGTSRAVARQRGQLRTAGAAGANNRSRSSTSSGSSSSSSGGSSSSTSSRKHRHVSQQQQQQQPLLQQWLQGLGLRLAQPFLEAARPSLQGRLLAAARRRTRGLLRSVAGRGRALSYSNPRSNNSANSAVGSQLPGAAAHGRLPAGLSGSSGQMGSLSGVQLQRLVLQQMGPPPEWQCEQLRVGQGELPVPVMPVELFGHMHAVLLQSYEAFREVRERLGV